MDIGMLWFDNDPKKTQEQKLLEGAAYYEKKYGASANFAGVHPAQVCTPPAGFKVEPMPWVIPNHIWIGVDTNAN